MSKYERIEAVLKAARKTVDYQVAKNHNAWGINLLPGVDTAIVAAPTFTFEIMGLTELKDYVKDTVPNEFLVKGNSNDDNWAFHSFFKDKADYPSLSRPIQEIMESVMTKVDPIGSCEFNVNSVINTLNQLNKEDSKKSRVVLAQGFTSEGTAPIRFGERDGKPYFSIKGLNKPCVISDGDGFIPVEYIEPNQSYECVLEQTSSEIIIKAIRKFGLVKLGVSISETLFVPENLPKINSFEIIPDVLTTTTNSVKLSKDDIIPPFHVSLPIFLDVFIVMNSLRCENATIHLPKDSNTKACIIESSNSDGLKVRIIMAPLNQSYGIQRR